MNTRNNKAGFTGVEILIVVLIVGLLGVLGYVFYNRMTHKTVSSTPATSSQQSSTTQSPAATDVSSAPTVSSASDLDSALNTLNQNDPATANGSDSSQLSSEASTF